MGHGCAQIGRVLRYTQSASQDFGPVEPEDISARQGKQVIVPVDFAISSKPAPGQIPLSGILLSALAVRRIATATARGIVYIYIYIYLYIYVCNVYIYIYIYVPHWTPSCRW